MKQETFRRMTSRARHIVRLREREEFVMFQFLLSVEYDTDEQYGGKDEMASKQNSARTASGQTHSDASA